jgi:hypothetical protein
VTVFSVQEGDFPLTSTLGQGRIGHRKLIPVATVKSGRLYSAATFPVPGSE